MVVMDVMVVGEVVMIVVMVLVVGGKSVEGEIVDEDENTLRGGMNRCTS